MTTQPPHSLFTARPAPREVVDATLAALGPDREYRLAHHADLTWEPQVEVAEVEPGQKFEAGASTVAVGRTDHRPVEPTVGYRIEQDGAAVVSNT